MIKLSIADEVVPLEPASRKKVKDVLESISSIMNAISIEYMDTEIIFGGLNTFKGAEALLYILDDGIKAEKERGERIRTGKFTDNDIKQKAL